LPIREIWVRQPGFNPAPRFLKRAAAVVNPVRRR
jgi:hypothetical protein